MAEDQERVGDNYTTHEYYSLQANQKKRSQREAVAFEELDRCSSSTTKITTQKPKNTVTTTTTTTTTTAATTAFTSRREIEEQELGGDNYSTTDHEYSLKANKKKRSHREAVACEELDPYSSYLTTKIPTQKPKIHHHLPYTLVIGKRRIYMRPKNIVTTTAATTTTTAFTSQKGNNVGEVLNHALQETSLPSIRR